MESKGENRTKTDIEAFNKSIKDFNAVVAKYNTTNKMCSEVNNNWNNAIKKHTPK